MLLPSVFSFSDPCLCNSRIWSWVDKRSNIVNIFAFQVYQSSIEKDYTHAQMLRELRKHDMSVKLMIFVTLFSNVPPFYFTRKTVDGIVNEWELKNPHFKENPERTFNLWWPCAWSNRWFWCIVCSDVYVAHVCSSSYRCAYRLPTAPPTHRFLIIIHNSVTV